MTTKIGEQWEAEFPDLGKMKVCGNSVLILIFILLIRESLPSSTTP
jgi:hypothetical protein